VHLTVALHAFRGADVQMHEDPRFYQDLDTKIKNSSERIYREKSMQIKNAN